MAYTSIKKASETPNFLESEVGLVLKTAQADGETEGVKEENGMKYLPAGTIFPKNDATAKGIVFTQADVTNGEHAVSIMVAGRALKDRIADGSPNDEAVKALAAGGLYLVDENGDVYAGAGE